MWGKIQRIVIFKGHQKQWAFRETAQRRPHGKRMKKDMVNLVEKSSIQWNCDMYPLLCTWRNLVGWTATYFDLFKYGTGTCQESGAFITQGWLILQENFEGTVAWEFPGSDKTENTRLLCFVFNIVAFKQPWVWSIWGNSFVGFMQRKCHGNFLVMVFVEF